ncbi:MAG: DUF423 domain-containing protein [Prolixibacteraceae bacterium]|nr:DUF423 domain-containing protein [Prolixibacteraceae bacterium]
MKNQTILISGAVFMALGVLLGAFGAHALKNILSPEMLAVYKTGVEYQFYHALGLLLIGLIGFHLKSKYLSWAGLFITIGIILFSGSLYVLTLSGMKAIGAITPVGGLSFVAGWASLLIGILKQKYTFE